MIRTTRYTPSVALALALGSARWTADYDYSGCGLPNTQLVICSGAGNFAARSYSAANHVRLVCHPGGGWARCDRGYSHCIPPYQK